MPKEELKIPKNKPPRKRDTSRSSCPPGFKWDAKKGKCVQKGVGKEYKP